MDIENIFVSTNNNNNNNNNDNNNDDDETLSKLRVKYEYTPGDDIPFLKW